MDTDAVLADVATGRMSAEQGFRLLRGLEDPGAPVAGMCFMPRWEPLALPAPAPPQAGPLLLFDLDEDLAAELRRTLEVVLVRPGERYQVGADGYRIRPDRPEDYRRLLQAEATGLLVHLWSRQPFGAEPERLKAQLAQSLLSLFPLSQALAERGVPARLLVGYVEPQPNPTYRALGGYVRTLRREHPAIACRAIGLGEPTADALLRELAADDAVEVRWRDGQRWTQRLQPLAQGAGAGLREGGVCLLSGGAGGLGGIFAEHLARTRRARLVLCGRSAPTPAIEARLAGLRALGAEACYHQADVSRREQVDALLAAIKAEHGALHGIIHTAGVLRDARLVDKIPADLSWVLAPKLQGTLNLDAATRDEPLDLLVLCSAVAGVLGNPGQCDYAYANAFLDHFADWREAERAAGRRVGRTLAVAWPLWREGGMAIDPATEELLARTTGLVPLDTPSGLAAFAAALRAPGGRIVVLPGDRAKIEDTLASAPAASLPASVGPPPRLVADLAELVAQVLRLEVSDLDAEEDVNEYGFDSITFTTLANRINGSLGLEVTPALFFEHTTLASIARHLWQAHGAGLAPHYGVDPSPAAAPVPAAEPERLPPAGSQNVAIVGMAGIMPQSPDLASFWEHLRAGDDLITLVPAERWDWQAVYGDPAREGDKTLAKWGGFIPGVDELDCLFFGISPREAERMDPQQRLFLGAVWHAIEDAGYRASELAGSDTGVFVGAAAPDYYELLRRHQVAIDGHTATGVSFSVLANRVSHFFDLHGPSQPVDTACSSSLVAVHKAVEAIRAGHCGLAIAGGVNVLLSPTLTIAAGKAGMLSPDGRCKTFDARADGYVRGEGVGAVLLKPLARAQADGDAVYAVIKASAENHGGHTGSLTTPNPRAQAELLVGAYEQAGVDPPTVGYIETHGTGTALGDPAEINGLKSAFQELYRRRGLAPPATPHCALGAVKTNLGHLETAAGIAGLIKAVLCLQHRWLPANLHQQALNPYIRLEGSPFYILGAGRAWAPPLDGEGRALPRRAGVSSFGFGGTNAHVVLEEYPPLPVMDSGAEEPQLVVLSARDEERLRAQAASLGRYLERALAAGKPPPLAHVAYTLQRGREPMAERLALVADSLEILADALGAYGAGGPPPAGLHRGSVQAPRSRAEPLIGGKAGEAFLRVAMEERDLSRLGRLWVDGVDIDFRLLHGAGRRLHLPGYPYARSRYWLPASGSPAGTVAGLHPLLDGPAVVADGQGYGLRLAGGEFFLTDHVVQGRKTLPGVVYVEMARAAGALARGGEVQRISRLVWSQPITVADEPVEVTTVLRPAGRHLDFEIGTPGAGGERRVHCQGRLEWEPPPEPGMLDLAAIRTRCQEHWSHADAYRLIHGNGFRSGPGFRPMQSLHRGAGEALARLELPAHLRPRAGDYLLHPSLLDGALQTVIGLLGDTEGIAWLPFALDELHIAGALPEFCHAHVRARDPGRLGGSGGACFDISIADAEGRVVVALRNLMFRALVPAAAETLCFRPGWRRRPAIPALPPPGCVLALLRSPERAAIVAEILGCRVVTACPGPELGQAPDGSYTLNPMEPAHYGRLLERLEQAGTVPDQVLHLWAGEPFDGEPATAIGQLELGPNALMRLLRAHLQRRPDAPLRVLYAYGEPAGAPQPPHAAVAAYGRALGLEHPVVVLRTVALPELAQLDALLPAELMAADAEVRYAEGERWVPGWEEIALAEAPAEPLKQRGVYLITGGAGGLGLILARHLASRCAARLVLAGRSPQDERIAVAVETLRALGAEVCYLQADLGDAATAERLVAETRARYGPIDGVLHCAGVLRDGRAARQSEADVQAVLAPKLWGTLALDRATRAEPLDFFLLYSSAAAAVGNAGQSAYAYANGFLDHYAEWRERQRAAGRRQGRTLSLAWPLWREGGMGVATATAAMLRKTRGVVPLPTDAGLQVFARLLAGEPCRVLVLHGEPARLRGLLEQQAPPAAGAPEPQAPVAASSPDPLPAFRADFLADVLAVLQLDSREIRLEDDLSAVGFDSLSFTELANRLNQRLGLDMTPAVFFRYPTLAAAAQSIYQRYRARLAAHYTPLVPAPPPVEVPAAVEPPAAANEPVAVIGVAGILPRSPDLAAFWDHLEQGHDLVREVPASRWDWRRHDGDLEQEPNRVRWAGLLDGVDRFDSLFFGISPREAEQMDPQHRLFLETAWHAIEDAGYRPSVLSGSRSGVFVGVSTTDYYELLREGGAVLDSHTATGIISAVLPNRVSYLLNLRGPSEAIDTACSSSLVAIHRAVSAIRSGECELALAGGANVILSPTLTIAGSRAGMLSPDGRCKTFDRSADGYVRGEGVGAVLLKPLSRAEADGDPIHALILGSAENHGGHGASLTAPNPQAQAEVIVAAHRRAGIDPATVGYIEAHGTGTSLGDPIEIDGLKLAFAELYRDWDRPQPATPHCGLGSVKTNMGHLEAAAGIAGVLKVVLAMRHGRLPGMLHFQALNPYIDLTGTPLRVITAGQDWPASAAADGTPLPRRAGVSSFGFGGVNAHVVLQAPPPARHPSVPVAPQLVLLSARSEERLRVAAGLLETFLETAEPSLEDLAYTLQVGREPMSCRMATVVSSLAELRARLGAHARGEGDGSDRMWMSGIAGGSPPEEQVAAALTKRDLEALAGLWLAGAEPDWAGLHAGRSPRRVSLPGYPFADTRHWVPRAAAAPASVLHPLLDANLSTLEQQCYGKRLLGTEPCLRDHVLGGQAVLPAVAYLEIMRAAGVLAGAVVQRLSGLVWSRPLVVGAEPVELRVALQPRQQGVAVEVYSLASDGSRESHAQGGLDQGAPAPAPMDLEALRADCPVAWEVAECYRLFARQGLGYGPSLRALQALHSGRAGALAELALPAAAGAGLEAWGLHPALLEGALQSILALLELQPDSTYLPFALGSLEQWEALPAHCYAHARPADRKGGGRTRRFDVTLLDASGRVLVRLRDFVMRQVALGEADLPVPEPVAMPAAATEPDGLREPTRRFLRRMLARETRLEEAAIHPGEPLERYGIDSMLVVSLTRALERHFGELPKTLLFEHQTLSELSEYFLAHHREALQGLLGVVPAAVTPATVEAPRLPARFRMAAADEPTRRPGDSEPIAIIGLSGRYPQAADLQALWENLKAGRDCITEIPPERWDWRRYFDADTGRKDRIYSKWGGFIADVDKFDPLFFNISPKEAELMDPQERLFLETVWHTVEDAGYGRESLRGCRVGVYVGVMWGEYQLYGPPELLQGRLLAPGASYASIANRVSYVYDWHGPSVALDSMCSSSLTAIHFACDSLRRGESELAVAGGVNVSIHPQKYIQLSQGRFAASDGRCRSFGTGGDGYVPGEGVGAVLLKPLSRAQADGDHIYGLIRGSSLNHGGKTNGYSVPNPKAQAALIADALARTGTEPASIGYLEAHGTGTALGDPIEVAALAAAFGDAGREARHCAIGSVKSNIGHLESAAGIAGLSKVLLQLRHRQLAPSIHTETLNPNIRFEQTPFRVQRELAEWPQPAGGGPRRAGISAFGAGGSNAHLLVEEYLAPAVDAAAADPQLVVLSARSAERLEAVVQGLLRHLRALEVAPPLADLAYTLQVGREAMSERLALVVPDLATLSARLQAYLDGADEVEDLYRGSVRPGGGSAQLLIDGEEGRAFLDVVVAGRRLGKLARLWVGGVAVDWALLHASRQPHRISLPGYPFARERYWVPQGAGAETGPGVHPLLDSNESTLDEQCYRKRLRGVEPWLADHRLGGRRVLPGVVSLEMARAAACLANRGVESGGIAELLWLRPVVVEAPQALWLSLVPGQDQVDFELGIGDDPSARTVHVRGRLLPGPTAADADVLNLAAARERCQRRLTAEECYGRLERHGLRHGPAMRSLRGLQLGRGELLAELALPPEAEQTEAYVLHPALMDGALQALVGLGEDTGGTYLPHTLERLDWHGPLPRHCYAHVVALAHDAEERRYDVRWADADGRVLAAMRGLTLRVAPALAAGAVYLRRVWQATSMPAPGPVDGPVLLFAHDAATAADLQARCGVLVLLVRPGEGFGEVQNGYRLAPDRPADYRALLQSLQRRERLPERIVYLWPGDGFGPERLKAALAGSIGPFFHLSQALLGQDRSLTLLYVYRTRPGELRPQHAAVAAYARTLRQEQPGLDCRVVAVQEDAELVEALAAELAAGSGEELHYGPGRRRQRVLQEVAPSVLGSGPSLLRQRGVYLITGGAGGLGLLLAEHLARTAQARVVLMGRSEPGNEAGARIAALSGAGAEVVYLRGDVGRPEDVAAVVAQTKARFGALHGVIHAAGVLRDGLLHNKTEGQLAEVLAPKVYGVVHLDLATAGEPLDFFLLYSSVAAVVGNAGQTAYAYANAFLDDYAEYRESLRAGGLRRGRTLAMDWPLWREGGMQAPPAVVEWAERSYGVRPLATATGLHALELGLGSELPTLTVLEGDPARIRRTLIAAAPPEAEHTGAAAESLRRPAEDYLKSLLAMEAKLSPGAIRADEPLERYGIDSVMVLNLTRALEADFGTLSKTLLFEHKTVAELAAYLMASHGQALAARLGEGAAPPSPPPARTAARRFTPTATRSAEAADPTGAVAVIGVSGRYPMAPDLETLWDNLEAGRDCITDVPPERWAPGRYGEVEGLSRWGGFLADVDAFDAQLFKVSPREARLMDPQERLFLETVWHTLEDGGYPRRRLAGRRVGVYVGVMWGEYQLLGLEASLDGKPTAPGASYASIANRVSYFWDFHGPSMAVDSMCSSSLTAVHLACESLRRGESEYALAGGVNLSLHPQKYLQLAQGRFTSSDGRCRSFGAGGDGYVPGEGVGAVLLKPLARALADGDRIHAVIRGSAINHGGKTNGYTVPNPQAQGAVLREALRAAGMDPAGVGYLEAHGTGTALGDPVEITGLLQAYDGPRPADTPCAIGSIKSNIGHLESAAGIAGLTKVLLQLRHGKLVPSLHAETLNPHIDFEHVPFRVQRRPETWAPATMGGTRVPRRAGISSFGAGGANAHLLVEEHMAPPAPVAEPGPCLVVLSAKTEERLWACAAQLAAFLDAGDAPALADLAYTLQVGREPLEQRLALVADSLEVLRERLAQGPQAVGLHRGNARAEGSEPPVPAGGAEIAELLRQGRLRELARLWVVGADLDWERLYPQRRPRLVGLPLYPFARERYWLPGAAQPRRAGALHPLLDGIDLRLSLEAQGLVLAKVLRPGEPIVRDHRVRGVPVMPGVGYLEMAHAAAAQVRDTAGLVFARVVWLQPLGVTGELEVQVLLRPQGAELAYEIRSTGSSGPVTHGKGILRPAPGEPVRQRVSVDEVRARCEHHLDGHSLYDRFRASGLEYGGYLQGITELWGGPEEALARLRLPAEHQGELARYALHPCLLDGALQAIAGIGGSEQGDRSTTLSFAVEAVELLAPLPASGYAYVRAAGAQHFDVSVLDDAGLECVRLREVAVRAMADPLADLFYAPRWRSWEPGRASGPAPESVLIVGHADTESLAAWLRRLHAGAAVAELRLGAQSRPLEESCWEVALDDPSALETALAPLPRPQRVYFLAAMSGASPPPDDWEALDQARQRGHMSLFRLLKLVAPPLQLVVLTNDLEVVVPQDEMRPFSAGLGALAGAAAAERPGLEVSCLDLVSRELEAPATLEQLQAWLERADTGDAALRQGRLYRHSLVPLDLPAPGLPPFREGGAYLIVGGAGGIGFELSRHLARTVRARLAWVGRRAQDAEIEGKMAELRALGAVVSYLQADVADAVAMQAAVYRVRSDYGALHGVIHSAMDIRPSLLEAMDEEAYAAALRAKLGGSVVLASSLRGESLDFLLLFSSAQSFIRGRGMSHYAAGCAFQDALARALSRRVPYAVQSVDWGYWGTVGVMAREDMAGQRRLIDALGFESIAPEQGMQALERIVACPGVVQVVPFRGDDALQRRMGVDRRQPLSAAPSRLPSLLPSLAAELTAPPIASGVLQRLGTATGELQAYARQLLLRALRRMGALQHAGEHYGPDSLRTRLGLDPVHGRLYEALLDILVAAGYLRHTDTGYVGTEVLDAPALEAALAELEARGDTLAREHPDIAAHLRLLRACLQAYPEVLRGRRSGTEVLFPNGSGELVEGVYRGNASVDYFNGLVGQVVATHVRAAAPLLPAGMLLRILELGAGTGGTTRAVLAALGNGVPSYVYTDKASGLVQQARRSLGEPYPGLEFGVLDIEQDPLSQGYRRADFDLIIAANVLHATRNIGQTLRHAKCLLRASGWLVLCETAAVQELTTLSFGLLDGWWRYDDGERRQPGSPLLSAGGWREALTEAGFRAIRCLGHEAEAGYESPQKVLAAESDGVLEQAPAAVSERAQAPAAISSPPVGSTGASLQSRVQSEVTGCVARVLEIDGGHCDPDTPYSELGVDSILAVEIVERVNERLAIGLRTTDLFNYPSIAKLSAHIVATFGADLSVTEAAPAIPVPAPEPDDDILTVLRSLSAGDISAEQADQLLVDLP